MVLVALWAFAEALLLFIVADVPISAIALHHGIRRAVMAALVAAVFAAFGGVVMLHWAASDPAGSRIMLESLPGISPALLDSAAAEWREGGAFAMLAGSFQGVPYKLYAHAAGIGGAGVAMFFTASIIARLPRFLLIALAFGALRPQLKKRLPQRVIWVLFAAGWSLFYAAYFTSMSN